MTTLDLEQLTRIALEVAEEAATFVARVYRTDVASTEKAKSDLVTEYDVASERLIRARLAERTPELAVVGEEQGGHASGPTWYIDPIDGTTNFVHGHPFFCVSIGLLDAGQPLVGAVVAPVLATRWYGFRGGTAFRDGAPCKVTTTHALSDALLATGFHPKSQHKSPDDNLSSFGRMLTEVRGIRRCGSAAIDLCMVADGTYDAYWERALNPWDIAAAAAIALAAGARITDLRGQAPNLSVGHILASNGHVHDGLLALMPESD